MGRSATVLLDNRNNKLVWSFFLLTEADFAEWVNRHGLDAICAEPGKPNMTQTPDGMYRYFQTWVKKMEWKSQAKRTHFW